MKITPWVAGFGLLLLPTTARTADVTGEVTLPRQEAKDPDEAVAPRGFTKRRENQTNAILPYDPRPECFVFLDGPADDAATRPMFAVLELSRTRFAALVFPVVAGSSVDIQNTSKKTHAVFVRGRDGLWGGDAIGAGRKRSGKAGSAYDVMELGASGAPHLTGRIVPLPTRYFATLGKSGEFVIKDVPEGSFTLRIWYRNGWLATTRRVDVGSRATKTSVVLPVLLKTEPPKNK